ncbi:RNA polymerase III transcription factor IIIC subunit-domain-containing protein [Mucidula mucida]|nr:RNA polymerase III transcription factor IIIC subunit-domain-containing protein [Mucidula mucida]
MDSMDVDQPEASTSASTNASIEARPLPLPSTPFYVVEYPGRVKPTSVPEAVKTLGGLGSLENAFKRGATKAETLVELHLRPDNPFAHPIPGSVVASNALLMKVVKRKKKRRHPGDPVVGHYTTEVVGVIPKTVRFRSMADYQFQPDMDDSISKLRMTMEHMDVDALCEYKIPEEKYDYTITVGEQVLPTAPKPSADPQFAMNLDPQLRPTEPTTRSNLRLFPPPIFSRQTIPQVYNFKANTASVASITVDEETGEEKKRLINRMRWKGYGPATISFTDATVPTKPPAVVESARDQVDEKLVKRLEERFDERPVWTRMSLFNQFAQGEAREIHNSKIILPLVCYVFQDGPWRDTLVKFGYDPRKINEARLYQRLYFRNANHPIARPSVTTRRQDRSTTNVLLDPTAGEGDRKTSHIFDGKTLTKETAAFQLCDISDPMLKGMIEDESDLRETCDERDGWYTTYAFERIKGVLRHKFFSLLQGHVAPDDECWKLLENVEGAATKSTAISKGHRLRAGKHNMAKGALRPEDAAALRLKTILDRNAKSLTTQR